MKGFPNFKEFASSVARINGSAAAASGRVARGKSSASEYVDAQIALLVETIEAEARQGRVRELDRAVEGRPAVPADSRRRPHLVRLASLAAAAGVFRRFHKWRHEILLYGAVVLVGVAVGLLAAVLGN